MPRKTRRAEKTNQEVDTPLVETVGEDIQERIRDSVRSAPSLTAKTTIPRKKRTMKAKVVSKAMTNYQAYMETVQDLSEKYMRDIAPDLVINGCNVKVSVQNELPEFGEGMHAVVTIVNPANECTKFNISVDIYTPDLVNDLPTVIEMLVNFYRARETEEE